jgi:hypothetical protein
MWKGGAFDLPGEGELENANIFSMRVPYKNGKRKGWNNVFGDHTLLL